MSSVFLPRVCRGLVYLFRVCYVIFVCRLLNRNLYSIVYQWKTIHLMILFFLVYIFLFSYKRVNKALKNFKSPSSIFFRIRSFTIFEVIFHGLLLEIFVQKTQPINFFFGSLRPPKKFSTNKVSNSNSWDRSFKGHIFRVIWGEKSILKKKYLVRIF